MRMVTETDPLLSVLTKLKISGGIKDKFVDIFELTLVFFS